MVAETIVEAIAAAVIEQLKQKSRVVIAVTGPQGSGKTTVTLATADFLSHKYNIPTLALSIDDFYKPYKDLQILVKTGNPLLKQRGLPGTHDTAMIEQFLNDFAAGNQNIEVPFYDKSLHSGAGDRAGFSKISNVSQAVLFEGWMVGFRPVTKEIISQAMPYLANSSVKPCEENILEINTALESYVPIWNQCAQFVRLKPEDVKYVYTWRMQQEHELKEKKGSGMSDTQVTEFVDQYMPCYYVYNRTLPTAPEAIVFTLGIDRRVICD